MANVKTYNCYGLSTTCHAVPQSLTSSGKTLDLTADIKGGKDALTLLVYMPDDALGDHVLTCKSADGLKETNFTLNCGCINVIHLTTHGIKKPDGTADFVFSTNASSVSALNSGICIVTHTEVENH